MTIAAAYLTSEGVVLGADSTTSVTGGPPGTPPGVLQLLEHAQKVFEVGEDSRLGVCTWGAGSIGNVSHRTLIARLADGIEEDTTVEDAAQRLADMAVPLAKDHDGFVGYYLGGWNPGSHDPACYRIEIGEKTRDPIPLKTGLCSFSGNHEFFNRVFRGFSPGLPKKLHEQLKRRLTGVSGFDKLFKGAFQDAVTDLATVGFQDLPIREAIDFVYSYLHISIKALKFRFGAPGCGGPIEIAFVTSDRKFRWACHKKFRTAIEEQKGDRDF